MVAIPPAREGGCGAGQGQGGNAGGQCVDTEERDVPQRGDNERLGDVKGRDLGERLQRASLWRR